MKKFDNYRSNLTVLSKAYMEDLENEFIISGIIGKFYSQFELAWKVLKELLRYEGNSIANIGSPREIIKAAYSVYDGNEAKELVNKIIVQYIPMFILMKEEIESRYQDIIDSL